MTTLVVIFVVADLAIIAASIHILGTIHQAEADRDWAEQEAWLRRLKTTAPRQRQRLRVTA